MPRTVQYRGNAAGCVLALPTAPLVHLRRARGVAPALNPMDFFQHQDEARRNTHWLVLFFAAGVVAVVLCVHLAAALLLMYATRSADGAGGAASFWDPRLFGGVTVGVLTVIGFATLYKIAELRAGGRVIAESLGGRLLVPGQAQDVNERKVLNVVEEMAIASGVPVPPVYLLEQEGGINAFAAGYSPDDAVIGVTRGCVEKLARDELQGVMAHEFSHVLNGDMRLNIRLIGVVYGIMALGLIGRGIFRALGRGRVRMSGGRGKKGGGGAIIAIILFALALVVIGFLGTLFGNLMKAAVSRQREFLADASAVQFTRNPGGIGGALRKIGGFVLGSSIASPSAEQASHMFFAQGLSNMWSSLAATHPPLPERIRRIDPSWDGSFPKVEPDEQTRERVERAHKPYRASGRGPAVAALADGVGPVATRPVVSAAVGSVGRPTEAHVAFAQQLLESLPQPLLDAAHETSGSRAVLFAMLLSGDAMVRQAQMNMIAQRAGKAVADEAHVLEPLVQSLDAHARLPLVDAMFPALRAMSEPQVKDFLTLLDALVRADRKIEVFEWVLKRIVERRLGGERDGGAVIQSLGAVTVECGHLLSVLAYAGSRTEEAVAHAFTYGVAELRAGQLQRLPRGEAGLPVLDRALSRLDRLAARHKRAVLAACAAVIGADRQLTGREAELLRGVADTLGCPMPPIPPTVVSV